MVDDPCSERRKIAKEAIDAWVIAPAQNKTEKMEAVIAAYADLTWCDGPDGFGRGNLDYCKKKRAERNAARRALEIAVGDGISNTVAKATNRLKEADEALAECLRQIE